MKTVISHSFETLEQRTLLAAFGTPVASYGADGGGGTMVEFDSGSTYAVELLADASARTIGVTSTTLIRYRTNGTVDSTFGNRGKIELAGSVQILDAALDRQGNIYTLVNDSRQSPARARLYRYTPNGQIDNGWAAGGFIDVLADQPVQTGQVTVQSDGKVLVAATVNSGGNPDDYYRVRTSSVLRFNSDGSVDPSFGGGDGRAELQLSATDSTFNMPQDTVFDVSIVAGNRIVVVGGAQPIKMTSTYNAKYGPSQFVAAKLNPDGSFDERFSDGNGYVRATHGRASAGVIMPDGSFAIGGFDESTRRTAVTQFEADGSVRFRAAPERNTVIAGVSDLAVLRDGRLAVASGDETGDTQSILSLTTISTDGRFNPGVIATLPNGAPAGSARLTTWGSALFVLDRDSRDLDSDDPYEQFMMKIDAGSRTERPGQFANVGASAIDQNYAGSDFVYYDSAAKKLMYAHRDTKGFWSAPEVVDGHARAGEQLSMASGDDRAPWIAYYDGADGDLKVAHRDSATGPWQITVIDSRGNVGKNPHLHTNGGSDIFVSYYDASKKDAKLAFVNSQKSWTVETVDGKGDSGKYSAVTQLWRDSKNVIAVAYTDGEGNLNYAERRTDSVYEKERLITSAAGKPGDIAFLDLASAEGKALISYHDGHNGDLGIAYQFTHTNKWAFRTLATSGVEGLYSRIVSRSPDGNVYVLSYNRSADRLTSFAIKASNPSVTIARNTIASGYGENVSAGSEFYYGNQYLASAVFAAFDSELGEYRILDGVLN